MLELLLLALLVPPSFGAPDAALTYVAAIGGMYLAFAAMARRPGDVCPARPSS